MYTEDEAKKKWCPMARSISQSGTSTAVAINKFDVDDLSAETRCIASTCMMWRWRKDALSVAGEIGYCGLAGKAG